MTFEFLGSNLEEPIYDGDFIAGYADLREDDSPLARDYEIALIELTRQNPEAGARIFQAAMEHPLSAAQVLAGRATGILILTNPELAAQILAKNLMSEHDDVRD